MSGAVLFEHRHRGNLWRLEVCELKGRRFANWRKWHDADGTWKPTRDGCTMPLEQLHELTLALVEHHGLSPR